MSSQKSPLVVIIGAGGIGAAIAQRIGSEKLLLLADYSQAVLDAASQSLKEHGHSIQTHPVDVTDPSSIQLLVDYASSLGPIHTVVHTAGVSPSIALASNIYSVNLLGAFLVIEAFQKVMTPGASLLCIASMAGHLHPMPSTDEEYFAKSPAAKVLETPSIDTETDSPEKAYGLSKRANILRVKASANAYGERGARINSISPGIISTELGQKELSSPHGAFIKQTIEACPAHRVGTAEDIAEAAAFLTGTGASFITGTDLLVDGGASGLMMEAIKQHMQQAAADASS